MNETRTFCFTKYFCNKSSYRNVSNIKNNILNRTTNPQKVINNIFNNKSTKHFINKSLQKQLSDKTKPIFIHLIKEYKSLSRDDFKTYFKNLKERSDQSDNIDVDEIGSVVVAILSKLISDEFYGCNKNKKMFMNLIRFILKGMLNQHITKERVLYNWDLNKIIWLSFLDSIETKQDILYKFITWFLKNTLCSIIAVRFYVTTTSITHETRKLYYFFKEDWQSLTDNIVRELLNDGDIIKSNSFSLGSRQKKRLSSVNKKERKFFLKQIPVARFMLKANNSIRIIIRYKKLFSFERNAIKNRRTMLKNLFPKSWSSKFENKYLELYKKWKENCEPKLYFVKVDLEDAFGKVDMNELKTYLAESHLNYQKTESNIQLKAFVAKEFQKFYHELKQSIYIRIGSCVYEWKRGLVQGMRFSPMLCEIFYNKFDEKYFSEFQMDSENEINCFVKYVDDYLYVTENLTKAKRFLEIFTSTCRINNSKTQCNFTWNEVQSVSKLPFCGFIIDTYNLEIMRDETVYTKQIRFRMNINEKISQPILFLERRITQTTVPLVPLYFNPFINSEKTIWYNIFITLCISANKFCTLVLLIFCENSKLFLIDDVINAYKKKVVVRMCDLITNMMTLNSNSNTNNAFCINHIRYLAYKVLIMFASKTHLCSFLIPSLTILMKKTNCKEGKWRDHASRINRTGKSVLPASKEICRSKNIIKYLNDFIIIPKNFEPFIKC